MPGKERVRPAITREMRLVSRLIEASPEVSDTSLAQFIARRRDPESGTLRRWAAAYGIPDRGPRIKITPKEFARGLKDAGIIL
jgi:hypothetical protein